MRIALPLLLLVLGSLAATGCRSDTGNDFYTVAVVQPITINSTATTVPVVYDLRHPFSRPARVVVEYTRDGREYLVPTEAGDPRSDGLEDLDTAPGGFRHTFVWALTSDVAREGPAGVHLRIRVTPFDALSGVQGLATLSNAFTVLSSTGP